MQKWIFIEVVIEMKNYISSKIGFFTIAAIFIWLKSYIIYLVEFNLDIQNSLQHFLLFINPISSTLVFLGIALFARGRRIGGYIIIIHARSEEHTSELQSRGHLVCRLLLEKQNK